MPEITSVGASNALNMAIWRRWALVGLGFASAMRGPASGLDLSCHKQGARLRSTPLASFRNTENCSRSSLMSKTKTKIENSRASFCCLRCIACLDHIGVDTYWQDGQ
jgi:hypothetical protein